ncbi:hypothetical protein VCUG_00755 [Vavraia culicis subsp. floridensis]|uniref:Uncharacterized protein n=1 Tax=Vavraia culicis (isolate floridensis) TaxID=948595 RepID=L2GVY5_VAVCU|nr:uncharacterized protein VCUG_00755 [Vavraia culicis subsp. floridensis]ELA47794.1 hypothetical protein VCUG_00755 [Vavraia culicis subsp. floridensis]
MPMAWFIGEEGLRDNFNGPLSDYDISVAWVSFITGRDENDVRHGDLKEISFILLTRLGMFVIVIVILLCCLYSFFGTKSKREEKETVYEESNDDDYNDTVKSYYLDEPVDDTKL